MNLRKPWESFTRRWKVGLSAAIPVEGLAVAGAGKFRYTTVVYALLINFGDQLKGDSDGSGPRITPADEHGAAVSARDS